MLLVSSTKTTIFLLRTTPRLPLPSIHWRTFQKNAQHNNIPRGGINHSTSSHTTRHQNQTSLTLVWARPPLRCSLQTQHLCNPPPKCGLQNGVSPPQITTPPLHQTTLKIPKQGNKEQPLKRNTRTGEKEDKHYSPTPYISPTNKNTTATTHTHHYRQLTTTWSEVTSMEYQ